MDILEVCISSSVVMTTAVKDICFNKDGTKFLSCGFDKVVRCWCTETGAVLHRFDTPDLPFCVRWTPEGNIINIYKIIKLETLVYAHEPTDVDQFLVACADRCVYQYAMNEEQELKQKYDRHLEAVSAIEFVVWI